MWFFFILAVGKHMSKLLLTLSILGSLLLQGSSSPFVEAQSSPKEMMEIEDKTLAVVNKYREKKGLGSLKAISFMDELAREHSLKMAQGIRSFGHRGWDARADQLFEKLEIEMVAENVAYNKGYDDPSDRVVEGWLKSKQHKGNILNEDFDITGMGVWQSDDGIFYFTQIFASYYEE